VSPLKLAEEVSRQQKPKLVDSRGYTYTVKEIKSSKQTGRTSTYWQCDNRTKKLYCPATVIEVMV